MLPLDIMTVERIAKLACDRDGPFERKGWQLQRLLRGAGWSDPPEYDGSPRVQWFVEAMEERRDDHAAIERLLCRMCDPLEYVEYEDYAAVADIVRAELNRILEPEQLVVSVVGGRPVLAQLRTHDSAPVFTAPEDLDQRLRGLIADHATVDILLERIAEVRACEGSKAYLLAVIGIGSFVEGLLFATLIEQNPDFHKRGFPDGNGRHTQSNRASLALLLDVAHREHLIQLDAKNFLEIVRDFRNFVHPRRQLELNFSPDAHTLMMCWAPVRAVLNDLEVALLPDTPDDGASRSR